MKKLTPLAFSFSIVFSVCLFPTKTFALGFGQSSYDNGLGAGLDMVLMNTSPLRNGENLWIRAQEGFQMQTVNPDLVRRYERQYANNPQALKRILGRGEKYLFFIMNEVEKRGMPTEIAFLPVVESAFIPKAKSHVGAAGLWQFMPATGQQYGLEQTWWYDGRRDVVESTRAALDYLQRLHGMFNDWSLALAAYNWGEGNVSRAISRAQAQGINPTYENIKLPNETRNYVPKLLAVRNVLSEPRKFGVHLDRMPNKPYFVAVSTGRHMDIEVAAKLAGMSVSDFEVLNPAFNLPVFAYKDGRQMLIPEKKLEHFEKNISKWRQPLLTWQVYTPNSTTSVESIASTFDMSVDQLVSINNLNRGATVQTGRPILVANRTGNQSSDTHLVATTLRTSAWETPQIATIDRSEVGKDESQSWIAKVEPTKAPVPVATTAPKPIEVAQIARAVEKPTPAIVKSEPTKVVESASATPSVNTVAKIKPTTVMAEAKLATNQPIETPTIANPPPKAIVVAQQTPIKIEAKQADIRPVLAKVETPVQPIIKAKLVDEPIKKSVDVQLANLDSDYYTVASGDTLYNISQRYSMSVDDLRSMNQIENNVIKIGMRLKVSGATYKATPVLAEAETGYRHANRLRNLNSGFQKVSNGGSDDTQEYIVQKGDTVYSIARKFGLRHNDIERWNDARKLSSLRPGQRVIVSGS